MTKLSRHGLGQRYTSSAGNVVLWTASTLLAIGLPLCAAAVWLRRRMKRLSTSLHPIWKPFLLLSLGWFALLAPWMVGRGKYTFSYHYLPSYGFALTAVAGAVAWLERRRAEVALGFVAAVAVVSLYFAPIWNETTLSDAAANRRLIFILWRP